MKQENLTPEESLLLISKTITETKKRFKENGHIFIFWGSLVFIVILSQYVLELMGLHKKFDIIWTSLLYPLGGIYTFLYVRKKMRNINMTPTIIGYNLRHMLWIIGMNLLIIGFIFSDELGDADGPIFMVLFAIMILISGLSIKFKPMIIGGVLVNLIGLGCFILDRKYYGLGMMLAAVVGFIIPGILLNRARKKENTK